MLLNLRAKCVNNNGASMTYTWRKIECVSEDEGHALAKQWGLASDNEFKSPDVDFPFQLKGVETSLPTDAELEEEDEYWRRDKMDGEIYDEDYDY